MIGRHGSSRSRKARDAMQDFVVTEAPRQHAKTLLQTNRLDMALDFVERHVGPPSTRLVLWWPDAPSTAGPDVTVAVPLAAYQEVAAVADQIVGAWDACWRLIDSTVSSQRQAARGDLVGAIAVALLCAAATGDEAGDHIGI